MTLQALELSNSRGSILTLPIYSITSGYSVRDIDGLDPVQSSQASSSFAGLDGEQYQSAHIGKRNILLDLGFEADYTTKTIQQLRRDLYGLLLPKSEVKLKFTSNDFPTVEIEGISESFEAPLFVQDPSARVSVLCYDPNFKDPAIKSFRANKITDMSLGTDVLNPGDVPAGLKIRLEFTNDLTTGTFTIFNNPAGQSPQLMMFQGDFLTGDIVEVSTVPGDKYATLTRGSVTTSILHTVSVQADWIKLLPGQNRVGVYVMSGWVNGYFDYQVLYGGL